MEVDFVTYEIAVKLKEKGFDELCLLHYTNEQILVQNSMESRIGDTIVVDDILDSYNRFNNECTDVPTISQVLKWLREKKHTYLYVDVCKAGYFFEVKCLRSFYMINTTFFDKHKSYEQAAIAGIEYVLNNLI